MPEMSVIVRIDRSPTEKSAKPTKKVGSNGNHFWGELSNSPSVVKKACTRDLMGRRVVIKRTGKEVRGRSGIKGRVRQGRSKVRLVVRSRSEVKSGKRSNCVRLFAQLMNAAK